MEITSKRKVVLRCARGWWAEGSGGSRGERETETEKADLVLNA